jgi:hypothetical protein
LPPLSPPHHRPLPRIISYSTESRFIGHLNESFATRSPR